MALRLLVCRTFSRTSINIFSQILCSVSRAVKNKKDNLWNSGYTRFWLVLLSSRSHRYHQHWLFFGVKLDWQTEWYSSQNSELHRLEGTVGCNTPVTPFVGTQSPTAVSTRCPDKGVKSTLSCLWSSFNSHSPASSFCCWQFLYLLPFPTAAKLLWDLKETANEYTQSLKQKELITKKKISKAGKLIPVWDICCKGFFWGLV